MKRNPIAALEQIGLNVSDLDVSEMFYQEVLGLRVAREYVHAPFRYASLSREGRTVLTLWEQIGGRFKKRRPGLHHLQFEVQSAQELDRIKGILDNLGAHWSKGTRLYKQERAATAIHFKDPDGIPIEVFGPDCRDQTSDDPQDIALKCPALRGSDWRIPETSPAPTND